MHVMFVSCFFMFRSSYFLRNQPAWNEINIHKIQLFIFGLNFYLHNIIKFTAFKKDAGAQQAKFARFWMILSFRFGHSAPAASVYIIC